MKTLFAALLMIACSASQAQETLYTYKVDGESEPIGATIYGDDEGNVLIRYSTVADQMAAVKVYTRHDVFLTKDSVKKVSSKAPASFNMFGYNKDYYLLVQDEAHVLQFSKTGRVIGSLPISFGEDKPVCEFIYNGHYFGLSMNKKEMRFRLRIVDDPKAVTIRDYAFADIQSDDPAFVDSEIVPILKEDKPLISFTGDGPGFFWADFINEKKDPPFVKNWVKTWFSGDKLVLARHSASGKKIMFIEMDTRSNKATGWTMPVPYLTYDFFPLGDRLFIFHNNKKEFNLDVASMPEKQVIKSFTLDHTAAVFHAPSMYGRKRQPDDMKEWLKAISGTGEVVTARKVQDKIKLAIGNFVEYYSNYSYRTVYTRTYGCLNENDLTPCGDTTPIEYRTDWDKVEEFQKNSNSTKERAKFENEKFIYSLIYVRKTDSFIVHRWASGK